MKDQKGVGTCYKGGSALFEDTIQEVAYFLWMKPKADYVRGGVGLMRRSKLEMQIDILKVLARRGPLKLTHVMYKANVNCSVLKQYMSFLIRQKLVEEQPVGKKSGRTRVVYAITEKGRSVLRYFKNLDTVLQITEEPVKIPALLY